MSDMPTDQEPRWHIEPFDPELDEAPEGAAEDCDGEHQEVEADG